MNKVIDNQLKWVKPMVTDRAAGHVYDWGDIEKVGVQSKAAADASFGAYATGKPLEVTGVDAKIKDAWKKGLNAVCLARIALFAAAAAVAVACTNHPAGERAMSTNPCPALLHALGTPDTKLDAWRATVPIRSPESEWVWAARGLALALSSDRSNVMQLVVYPPTTVETYRAQIRFDEAPRERPM